MGSRPDIYKGSNEVPEHENCLHTVCLYLGDKYCYPFSPSYFLKLNCHCYFPMSKRWYEIGCQPVCLNYPALHFSVVFYLLPNLLVLMAIDSREDMMWVSPSVQIDLLFHYTALCLILIYPFGALQFCHHSLLVVQWSTAFFTKILSQFETE